MLILVPLASSRNLLGGGGYKAEKILFGGHFLINVARELATEHSMRW